MELQPDPESGPERELLSKTLGVSLRVAGPLIRVRNLMTGEDYRSHREMRTESKADKARAEAEKARAEAEKARAEAVTEKLRVQEQMTEAEKARAEAAEAALKALLMDSGKQVSQDQ